MGKDGKGLMMECSPVIIGVLSGALGGAIIKRFGDKLVSIDIPNERSSHNAPTPRGGGAGIILAFLLTAVFITGEIMSTFTGVGIGLLGFLEDRFTLTPGLRLAVQLLIAAAVCVPSGVHGLNLNTAFIIFWIVFITGTANFYNFADGINGIAGLMGLVVFWLLAAFSFLIAKDTETGMESLAIGAACLGFLPLNLPKAHVFMGDLGSMFLGFEFGLMVYRLSGSISAFLCLSMFMCVFYADGLLTMYYRWRRGENLMKAHRSHLYQFLANELRLPHWAVSFTYAAVQLITGILAILAYASGIQWQLALVAMFSIFSFTVYRLIKGLSPRIYKFKKLEEI